MVHPYPAPAFRFAQLVVAIPARYAPGMTMRATRDEYYLDGKKQAKKLFDELHPRRNHGVDLTTDTKTVSQRIDPLPGDTLMQAALADLWLQLDQKEGMDRRKLAPPPSPFRKIAGRGNAKWATKDEIKDWDAAWQLRDAASAIRQRMMRSGASKVATASAILHRKLMWLVENGDVLGWIEDVDVEAFQRAEIEHLDIQAWTVQQALHRPWKDPQEQRLWANRYRAGNRLLEAEVEKLALTALARPRADETKPPPL